MKRNKITLQFIENGLIILQKEKLSKYKLESVNNYTVINKDLFIEEITPKISVISVGENNKYNHPNSNVLKVLENTKIYRTDKQGSIMIKIKNNKLQIESRST